MLEHAVKTGPEFAKLFGITTVSKASLNAAEYPYVLSDVAELIGGEKAHWNVAQKYISRILSEKGIDIKKSDNKYHYATKTGRSQKSITHKYSSDFVDLCKSIQMNQDYELDL